MLDKQKVFCIIKYRYRKLSVKQKDTEIFLDILCGNCILEYFLQKVNMFTEYFLIKKGDEVFDLRQNQGSMQVQRSKRYIS